MNIITFILLCLFSTHASARAAVNLEESFQASVKRSEDLASSEELVNQAEERYHEAVGAVLPNVNFVGILLKQDNGAAANSTSTSAGSLSPSNQKTYKITATQPLFRGLREYAALSQSKTLTRVQENQRDALYLQLFQDVAVAFYNVLANEKDLLNLQSQIDVNNKRLKDVGQFRKLGRSREADVLTVQSSIATLEYAVVQSQTARATSRATYSYLTGLEKSVELYDNETFPTALEPVAKLISKIDERPDIKAAIEQVEASDKGVSIAKGAHLPSLDLNGNYYFTRPGYLSDVKWDVSLGLTFPIFAGGATQSAVRVAASVLKQSDLALSKVRRAAQEQIDTTYAQVLGDIAQVEKEKRSMDIYNRSYQAEAKDYRYGLVTNLEVLVSQDTLQMNQRSVDRLTYQFRADYLRLQAMVANRPSLRKVAAKE